MATIIYTHTDEAPLLATYSFLPIIAGVRRQGRRRGRDPRHLAGGPHPRAVPGPAAATTSASADALAELGELATTPEANIIKLPNISASVPQLKAAIKELQEQGYDLPDYPENPQPTRTGTIRAPLRQGQGLGGQPGAARGQLRPPRAGVGQELRQDAPAPDGRVVAPTRRPTSPRWARTTSAPTRSRSCSRPTTRCASSTSPPTAPSPCSRSRSRCSPARSSTAPS